ncbi:hypothetical protein FRC19_006049 [Serendipita sp. 401]|nr:hypothetical protein FRC19_006049 [Serendipita sp. 401]KAG9054443.1 hypothetical protein FS842_005130 [Serendipita sp. 407]
MRVMHFLAALSLFFLNCSYTVLGAPLGASDAAVAEAAESRCGNEVAPAEVAAIEARVTQDFKKAADITKRADPFVVNVAWHVIYTDKTTAGGYLSNELVSGSMLALNDHYRGSGFTFKYSLGNITRTHNDDWFKNARKGTRAESAMKNSLARGDSKVLNIYSVGLTGGLLGYATFPWDYATNQKLDGVVFLHSTIAGGSMANYNQGKTLTHEVGHWLGLYHVFQGRSCTGYGDYVADTPPQKTPTSGCPPSKSSCPNNGGDSIHNFMDYSYDRCLLGFTYGQKERARKMASFYRGI